MPTTTTKTAAALLAALTLLFCVLAVPADAQSARRRRDAARAKRAQIAARLNAERASDAQLSGALRTLNGQVATEAAKAEAARQRVAAAGRAEAQARTQLAETAERIAGIRGAVVERAVSSYLRPREDVVLEETLSPSQASRREALLSQVLANDQDLLDQLRAAREDLELQRVAAERARAVAQARRRQVEAKLQALQTARAEKARVAQAVAERIRDYTLEAEAIAAEEASLLGLISVESKYNGPSSGGMIWPVRGRVTSGFGARWGRQHAGLDIAAPTGTPIKAAKAGRVISAGWRGGYGLAVVIDHGAGLSTLYAHQSRLGSSGGQVVGQGDIIGFVGSTGRSTGPHTHFETRVNGAPRNPRPYLP